MAPLRPFAAALLAALASLSCRPADADPGSGAAPPSQAPPAWGEVERLLDEQKLAEAAPLVERIEAAARAAGDDLELARALVRATQIGLALGGYETAVEALAAKPWPAEPRARAAVELYQAHALIGYLDAYGWEIGRREKVVSGEKLDLKLWTRDQISAECGHDPKKPAAMLRREEAKYAHRLARLPIRRRPPPGGPRPADVAESRAFLRRGGGSAPCGTEAASNALTSKRLKLQTLNRMMTCSL